MNARDQLALFVALQRQLLARAALRRENETPPEPLLALRSTSAARQDALGPKQARRAALTAEQESLAGALEALREEREHFRKQKSMVTNMKQLTAVVSELDHVETELKAKEERLLEIMTELETIEKDIAALSLESPEERAAREAAEAAWEERRRSASSELVEVERRLRDTQKQLGDKAIDRFKKLWAVRRPNAVVPIDGTACSACHAEVRPSLLQQVRAVDSIEHCDSCRRMLYDPEQFPPDVG